MASTAQQATKAKAEELPLAGVPIGPLAEADRRPGLHPAELRAVRGRRVVPGTRDAAHARRSGKSSTSSSSRSGRRVSSTSPRFRARSRRTPPATSTVRTRSIVGLQTEAPLKRAIMPHGRLPDGAGRAQGLRPHARPARRRGVHQVPEDPQRRGVRRLHRGHPEVPQLARPHRAARRLRPRPHHRGLPARRALRRRPADRAEAAREGRARRRDVHGRDHPRPRGALRADAGPQRAAEDGRELRLRHRAPGGDREGSGPVALLRLPRGGEGAERRRHVARADLDLPRRLLRARPRGGRAHRGAGPGDRSTTS